MAYIMKKTTKQKEIIKTYPDSLTTPTPIDNASPLVIPYVSEGVRAGFPSPAQDYVTDGIDLNRELVHHPESTFYARVSGHSMSGAGIDDGDLVIIDRSLEPRSGDYVVACIDGDFTLKQYRPDPVEPYAYLMPANEEFQPIKVTAENEFIIWGVAIYVIRKLRP